MPSLDERRSEQRKQREIDRGLLEVGGSVPLEDYFRSRFAGTPYSGTEAFENLIGNFASDPGKYLISEGNIDTWVPVIQGYAGTFQQMFRNMVGRDPNESEYNQFFQSVVNPDWIHPQDPGLLREKTTGLLNQFYGRLAEDEALDRARREAEEALAPGSAFDEWQKAYLGGITETEQALSDYQTRLFEKLRPQLMTSLQAQRLLNTGALNEAFAGAAKDLSDESQRFLIGARTAANQDIANRRYEISASPQNYALQREFGVAPNLTAAGQAALDRVFQSYLSRQNYEQERDLMDRYGGGGDDTSLLSQYGGQLLGGVIGGFGKGFGGRLANIGRKAPLPLHGPGF